MTHLTLDFVSDVSCPWCAVGLGALQQALRRLAPQITADLHFHPFELNPHMGPGGQDLGEHLTEKYGSSPQQQAFIREQIRQRGAQVGFEFHPDGRGRIYNTFDAHRLLNWAATISPAAQLALKIALLQACHRDREAMDDHAVLLKAAKAAELPAQTAQQVLSSTACAEQVLQSQAYYREAGIQSVPAVIINQRHLVSGGQPAEVFEQALLKVATPPT